MASKTTLQYGSKGNEVKELQQYLVNNGYKLGVDGIFGDNTLSAVKDYQRQSGLSVDGIVGDNTWGKLLGSNTTANQNTASNESTNGFKYNDFTYDDFKQKSYQESDVVKQAQAALNAQLAQKPGEYQSQWQTQLDDTLNKIMNREKFSYDFNGDALYQQYKDKFIQQGKMASADVSGQAAAMTGGYGNSYAATVGNQAYQASLQNLNDIIPELYQMAYDKYNQEGQDLLNQYSILGDRENTDYGRYRDTVSDWSNERNYLADRYDSERDYDYSKYTDDRNFNYSKYSDDRNFAYGKYADDKSYAYTEHRNAIADEQWQKEFDEAMRQYNESMAFQKQQYNENMAFQKQQYEDSKKTVSLNAGSSGGSTGGSGAGNSGESTSVLSGVRESIKTKAESFSTNEGLKNYLNGLVADNELTEDQATELYGQYRNDVEDFKNRKWTQVDDGGINWFWGVDNDAVVQDQYGNKYRLDELVDKLVEQGMSEDDAEKFVKKYN